MLDCVGHVAELMLRPLPVEEVIHAHLVDHSFDDRVRFLIFHDSTYFLNELRAMATSISPPSFLIRAGRPSCNLCKIAKALFSQYTCPIPLWLSLPMRQFAAERD